MKRRSNCSYAKKYKAIFPPKCGCLACERKWNRKKYALALIVLAGCYDAQLASIGAIGSEASVKCYSGGQLIYEGKSTGRVSSTSQSDGWEFMEAGSHNFI